jgi:hypothetical protein
MTRPIASHAPSLIQVPGIRSSEVATPPTAQHMVRALGSTGMKPVIDRDT